MEQGSQGLVRFSGIEVRFRQLIWDQDQLPAEGHGGSAGSLHQPATVDRAEGHDPYLMLCVPIGLPKSLRILSGADGAVSQRVFSLLFGEG